MPAAVLVPPKTAKTSRLGPAPRRTLKRPSSSVVTVVARRCSAAPGSNRSITVSDRPPVRRVRAHRQPPAERRARSVADDPLPRQRPEPVSEARDQRRPRLERVGQHHRRAVRPPRGGARVAGPVVAGDAELVLAGRIVLRAPAAEQGLAGAEGRQRLVGIGRAGARARRSRRGPGPARRAGRETRASISSGIAPGPRSRRRRRAGGSRSIRSGAVAGGSFAWPFESAPSLTLPAASRA